MCRAIRTLRVGEAVATDEELRVAALQFVRKISGLHHAPQSGAAPFEEAVEQIAAVSSTLLQALGPVALRA